MNKVKFQPLRDRVLIKIQPPQENNIVVLSNEHETFERGIVKAVGPEVKYLEANDEVWITKLSALPIQVDDNDYVTIREKTILAFRRNKDGQEPLS